MLQTKLNNEKQHKHVFSISSFPNVRIPKYFRPKRNRNHIATSISKNSGSSNEYFKQSPSKINTEYFPYYVLKEESIWKRHEKEQGILDKALFISKNEFVSQNLSLKIQSNNIEINKTNNNNSLNDLSEQDERNSIQEVFEKFENSTESIPLIASNNQEKEISQVNFKNEEINVGLQKGLIQKEDRKETKTKTEAKTERERERETETENKISGINPNSINNVGKFINTKTINENTAENHRTNSLNMAERTFNHETKKSSINSDLKEFILSPDQNNYPQSDLFYSLQNGYEDFSIQSNSKVLKDEFQKFDNSHLIEKESDYFTKKCTANSTIPTSKKINLRTPVTNSHKSSPSNQIKKFEKFNKYYKLKSNKLQSEVKIKKKNFEPRRLTKNKSNIVNNINLIPEPIITSDSIFHQKHHRNNVEGKLKSETNIIENNLKLFILKALN